MAKVVLPLGSMEVRGKVGGFIFNTYRGISTVKAFKSPSQPNSAAQVNARARLTDATRAWASLTASQRVQWQVFSADHLEPDWTGKPKRLTGHNIFCRLYTRLAMVGGAAPTVPPVVAAPAAPLNLTLEYNAGGGGVIRAAYTSAIPANTKRIFYGLGPVSAGRVPKKEYAVIKKMLTSADATPQTIIATPASGKWGFWVEDISTTTGLVSGQLYFEVTAP
jgi:hypothetical protein